MQVTGSVLNIQEITHTFLVMKIIDFIRHMYLHWHYFIKNGSRWSGRCEKIEKWCLLKLTGRKGFVKGSHCSKFHSLKRASVKQLFINHLGLPIISFTNLQIWKKWREKEIGVSRTFKKVQTIQRVNFIIKQY